MQRCLFFFLLTATLLRGQDTGFPLAGARSAALGHSSVALVDAWAAFHNPASLVFAERASLAFSHQRLYGLSDLQLTQAALAIPTQRGAWGLALQQFGFNEYQSTQVGLSYGQQIHRRFSMGAQLLLDRQFIAEGGARYTPLVALSFCAQPSENLRLGFSLHNPLLQERHAGEELPTVMRLGLVYRFGKRFWWSHELSGSLRESLRYGSGIEYQLLENWTLRSGFSWQDEIFGAAGMGFYFKAWQAQLSYQWGHLLGGHFIYSIAFRF